MVVKTTGRGRKWKYIYPFLFTSAVIIFLFILFLQVAQPWNKYNYEEAKYVSDVMGSDVAADSSENDDKEANEENNITVVFGGDVMMARTVGSNIIYQGFDPFASTKGILSAADLAMVNLECVISNIGYKNAYKAYTFRAPIETLDVIKSAGIDIVSLANNHVADYGNSAFLDMLGRLEQKSIGYVGGGRNEDEAYLPLYVNIKGVRLAVLSFSNIEIPWFKAAGDKAGIAWFEDEKIVEMLKVARENSDFVIVMTHWGTEYTSVLDEEQIRLAHLLIDSGTDLVIGGHPHHIQSIENYNGGRIYYSLGNYIFDGPGTHSGWYDGILVELTLNTSTLSPSFSEHAYKLDNKGLATLVE